MFQAWSKDKKEDAGTDCFRCQHALRYFFLNGENIEEGLCMGDPSQDAHAIRPV